MGNFATTVLVAGAAFLFAVFGGSTVQAEDTVELVSVSAVCQSDGNVLAKAVLRNDGSQDKSVEVHLQLGQILDEFEVLGEETDKVTLSAGEEGGAQAVFETEGADPSAKTWVVSAWLTDDVEQHPSHHFEPCAGPIPTLITPAMATPIPTESPTPTQTLLVSDTSSKAQPPPPPAVVVLPDTGQGSGGHDSALNPPPVLITALALSGSLLGFAWRTVHR